MILNELEESSVYTEMKPLPDGGAGNWGEQYATIPAFLCPSMPRQSDSPTALKETHYDGVAGPGRGQKRLALNQTVYGDVAFDGVFYPVFKAPSGSNANLLPSSGIRICQIIAGTSKTLAIGERSFSISDWMTGGVWEGNPATTIANRGSKNTRYRINTPVDAAGKFVDADGTTKKMLINDLVFSSNHPGGAQFCLADGSAKMINNDIDFTVYQDICTIVGGTSTGRS